MAQRGQKQWLVSSYKRKSEESYMIAKVIYRRTEDIDIMIRFGNAGDELCHLQCERHFNIYRYNF